MRRIRTLTATRILAAAVLIASSFALGNATASKHDTYQVANVHKAGIDLGGTLESVPCGALEGHLVHANWEEERTIAVAQSECLEVGAL